MKIFLRIDNINKFIVWFNERREKIEKERIGIIFNSLDFEFFNLRDYEDFLVILAINYSLPNIVPNIILKKRIVKSISSRGIEVKLFSPVEALELLLVNRCGERFVKNEPGVIIGTPSESL